MAPVFQGYWKVLLLVVVMAAEAVAAAVDASQHSKAAARIRNMGSHSPLCNLSLTLLPQYPCCMLMGWFHVLVAHVQLEGDAKNNVSLVHSAR